jgi:hypothetical protein
MARGRLWGYRMLDFTAYVFDVSCVGGYLCLLLSLNLGLDLCSEFLLQQDELLNSAFHSLEYTLVFTYLLVIFAFPESSSSPSPQRHSLLHFSPPHLRQWLQSVLDLQSVISSLSP